MSTKHGKLLAQAFKRLQGGELILKGYENETIADIVDVSISSVTNWRKILNAHNDDLCSLVRKIGSGCPPSLNDPQKQQFKQILLDGAVAAGYPAERWTSKIVAHLIKKKFGVELAPRSVRDLLPTLGLSPEMPVVKSHKYDEIAAMKVGKSHLETIKKKQKNSAFL